MSRCVLAQVQVLPAEPVVGVTLEAYTKCEHGNKAHQIRGDDDISGSTQLGDVSDAFGLRHQWLRSIDYRESFCGVHPERTATVFCAFWRPDLVPYGYTYSDACHCNLACFCSHFHLQRQHLEKAEQALRRSIDGTRMSHYLRCRCPSDKVKPCFPQVQVKMDPPNDQVKAHH